MIYVTSDFHYNHNKEFIYKARSFNTIEEHNIAIVERYNSRITDKDDVYILGDLYLSGPNELIPQFLEQLNGRKYLIRGNHDTNERIKIYEPYFEWIKDYYELKYYKKSFILCHYPFEVWNSGHGNNYHLHAHSHGSLATKLPNRIDIGVDTNNCYPYSIEEVITKLRETRDTITEGFGIDHHEKRTSNRDSKEKGKSRNM